MGVDPFQEQVKNNVSTNNLLDSKDKNEQLLHYANQNIEYLTNDLRHNDTIVTISDSNGLLLESYGNASVWKEAEKINFLPGAIWNEQSAGTNAIGTVIEKKQAKHIMFSEHFSVGWQDWFCAGAPILNPFTNELMGVLDLSGRWGSTNQHSLSLVIAKANSISSHIKQILYHEVLKINPFIITAIDSGEDGVIITDNESNIVNVNEKLRTFPFNIIKGHTLKDYPQIKSLVDTMLNKNKSIVEKEIFIGKEKIKYLCTIYPVVFNQKNIIGSFVRLQKSNSFNKRMFKGKTFPSSKKSYTFSQIKGSSPIFNKIIQKAKKAASLNSTLLLNGETGTGKELFVQAIHNESERRNKPFIAINCGAISASLINSELFGYEEGAFTGANKTGNPGKFESANGGTIFLDEIGDMSLEAQVHLLRVLEERIVTRIGGNKEIPIDVRVIAATNQNLQNAVEKGTFRADLLFRLRVIHLNIPSLRERVEDIPSLVHYFINELSGEFGKGNIEINSEAMKKLETYAWPGNIRELKNVIEQSLFNMNGDIIFPTDLPEELRDQNMKIENNQTEKNRYIEMIRSTDGNLSKAAVQLGISRATIYRRMKRWNITKDLLN